MAAEKQQAQQAEPEVKKPTCGIVMPISAIDDCSAGHWEEVKSILTDAISSAGYEANIVSDADDIGVIQSRIVQNLYNNEIVVCDVSCKNPNVMFELGMRLAFDKPTIIIMDDQTDYSFDTGIIEHLLYPRDLNYHKIITFKDALKRKILGSIENSKKSGHTTFLKHFGSFTPARMDFKEVGFSDMVLSKLDDVQKQIAKVRNEGTSYIWNVNNIPSFLSQIKRSIHDYCCQYCKTTTMLKSTNNRSSLYNYVIHQMRQWNISEHALKNIIDEMI